MSLILKKKITLSGGPLGNIEMNTHILASKSGFWKAQSPDHSERIFAHSTLPSPGPTCNRSIRITLCPQILPSLTGVSGW